MLKTMQKIKFCANYICKAITIFALGFKLFATILHSNVNLSRFNESSSIFYYYTNTWKFPIMYSASDGTASQTGPLVGREYLAFYSPSIRLNIPGKKE